MLEKLDALKQELEFAENAYGDVRSPDFSGMPRGSSDPSKSPMVEAVIRKIELENRVKKKEAEIAADWSEIEPYVEQLKPIETLIVNLRYYYGAEWKDVCATVYGRRKDYEEEIDRYTHNVFLIHGRALAALADMGVGYSAGVPQESEGLPN